MCLMIVPTLRVVAHGLTLCVKERRTQSVQSGVTTRSVGTINGEGANPPHSSECGPDPRNLRLLLQGVIVVSVLRVCPLIVPTLRVVTHRLTLCVRERRTQSVQSGVATGSVGTINKANKNGDLLRSPFLRLAQVYLAG
jgi:hypothetical protein